MLSEFYQLEMAEGSWNAHISGISQKHERQQNDLLSVVDVDQTINQ